MGQPLSVVWNIAVPVTVFAACLVVTLLVYDSVYDRGVKEQGKLLDMVDNMEYFLSGESNKDIQVTIRWMILRSIPVMKLWMR